MDIHSTVKKIAEDAVAASRRLSHCSANVKNAALLRMADEMTWRRDFILAENKRDVLLAREKGLSSAMIDRLTLTNDGIENMVQGLREVADLRDPVGIVGILELEESVDDLLLRRRDADPESRERVRL